MSAIKTPAEKKRLSLERDRRNRYGENTKSSRKNIPRGKERQHRDERRAASKLLGRLAGQVEADNAADIELLVKTSVIDSRRRGFKKRPDVPLGLVLAKRRARTS